LIINFILSEKHQLNYENMIDRIEGHIVDVVGREIFEGSVEVENGFITAINRHPVERKSYIMPGFIDAHVHIESSMLTPENFGNVVIREGRSRWLPIRMK
jgi:adenine deaminase